MFNNRYIRQTTLSGFGHEGQQKLQQSKVLVVGAGGLGVPVLQYLVAMGVGCIGIIDGDVVAASNLNRQVLYAEQDIGKAKSEVAAAKLSLQNPSVQINAIAENLTIHNAEELIAQYDLVIDATDNIAARYLINDACVITDKPFVFGAIYKFEGHVSVFNLGNGPTYRCLYPNYPETEEVPGCDAAGVLGIVPGLVGCEQALEAIKVLTGIGEIASGYLRIFDFLNNDQTRIKLKANPANKQIKALQNAYGSASCDTVQQIDSATFLNLLSQEGSVVVDVRNRDEFESGHLQQAVNIPLPELANRLSEVPTGKNIIVVCQQGGRSLQAAQLISQTFSNVYSLTGGMNALNHESSIIKVV